MTKRILLEATRGLRSTMFSSLSLRKFRPTTAEEKRVVNELSDLTRANNVVPARAGGLGPGVLAVQCFGCYSCCLACSSRGTVPVLPLKFLTTLVGFLVSAWQQPWMTRRPCKCTKSFLACGVHNACFPCRIIPLNCRHTVLVWVIATEAL